MAMNLSLFWCGILHTHAYQTISHPELGAESTTQHENNQDIQSINEKKAFCNNYDINKFLLKSHKMYELILLLLVSDILQM